MEIGTKNNASYKKKNTFLRCFADTFLIFKDKSAIATEK